MVHFKLKILTTTMLTVFSYGASYAAQMTNQQIQALVDQVVAEKTQGLQKEVGQLKSEVINLKQQLNATKKMPVLITLHNSRRRAVVHRQDVSTSMDATQPNHPNYTGTTVFPTKLDVNNSALTRLYLGGVPVFASPYIGKHSLYDGSDLIVNQSTVNLDTRLLKQAQALDNAFVEKGFPVPQKPVVELSGEVEGVGTVTQKHPGTTNGDINLSDAELDVYAQANPWVFGYASFAWADSFNSPYRVSNANAIIDKAFITIGNLSKSPFYGSLGQLYVPFGQYPSYMISDPLTKTLARTKARAAVIGFYPKGDIGTFGSAYVFKSDTRESDKSTAGGINLGYEFNLHNIIGDIAVGGISNIADSNGMQTTFAPDTIPFSGFGMNSAAENIFHAVPAVDINGMATYKHFNLLGEYIDTTTRFDSRAMTFNGIGAHPSSGQVEGAYTFTACGRPGSFAIGYNWTQDALALLLPRQRYIATINYSIWRYTLESLEFRHDINYSETDTASGAGTPTFTPLDKYVNMATLQLAVFF